MIITRTPLRITLGGGGTDLPSYYATFGGFLISAAINKHIYIALNRTFSQDYVLKYSTLERVQNVDDIDHPLIREALRLHDIAPAIELVSVADIPAETGLGSSGSFTVGLLRALYAFKRHHTTAANLAEEACRIEMEILERPVGKQDQFIAAFGSLTCFEFKHDGEVHVSPLMLSNETVRDLEEHLLLFFTGYSRQAQKVLAEQRTRSEAGDSEMFEALHRAKQIGMESKKALEGGDLRQFAALMDEHWQEKKRRSSSMSNATIDAWYRRGIESGALGGKLVGAGAGGFLMFYTEQPQRLRRAMSDVGLSEVGFQFDHDGSVVMVRD